MKHIYNFLFFLYVVILFSIFFIPFIICMYFYGGIENVKNTCINIYYLIFNKWPNNKTKNFVKFNYKEKIKCIIG